MLEGTDAGTGFRDDVGMWGGSAFQPHSRGGVRGGEKGHTHTHTQEHKQERTRKCCTYPLATYPLKSARGFPVAVAAIFGRSEKVFGIRCFVSKFLGVPC